MIKNALSITITRLLAAIVTLVLVLFTARIYGASGRGEISLLLLSITFVTIVAGLLAGPSLVYLLNKINVRNAYLISMVWVLISSIVTGVIIVQLQLIAPVFYVWIIALGALQSAFQAHQYFVLASNNVRAFNYSTLVQSSAMVLCFLALEYWHPMQLTNYCVAQLLSCLVGVVPTLRYLFAVHQPTTTTNETLSTTANTIITTGIVTQTANIVQLVSYRLNFYIIKHEIDVATVGIYSISIMITDTILIVSKSMGTSLYASVASNTGGNTPQVAIRNIKLSVLLTAVAYIAVGIVPQALIVLLFSEEFIPVKAWCLYSAFAALVFTGVVGISNYFSGNGQFATNTIGSVISALCILVLGWPCVHYWGVYGAITATTIATIAHFMYLWHTFNKQYNYTLQLMQLLPNPALIQEIIVKIKHKLKGYL